MYNPFFSIIVPVYNVQDYLKKCIQSLRDQTFSNFECILVDDGSTDNSPIICDEIIKNDSRFHVIHKPNEGVAIARNIGIEKSSGEYILFLDSDDTFELNLLENIVNETKKNSYDIIVFGYKRIREDGSIIKQTTPPEKCTLEKMYSNFSDLTFLLVNKAYKRNLFEKINPKIVEGITFSEDSLLALSLQKNTNKYAFLTQAAYNYLCRSTSVTQKMSLKNHEDRMKAVKLMDSLYDTEQVKPKVLKALKFDTKFFYIDPRITYNKETFLQNCKIWRETFPESSSQKTSEIGTVKMALYILLIRFHFDKIAYKFYMLKQK